MNLTKTQQELVDQINQGAKLQVVGATGRYRHAVLSPANSDMKKKDSRRKFVRASTVNALFKKGVLEEVVVQDGTPCPPTYADLVF